MPGSRAVVLEAVGVLAILVLFSSFLPSTANRSTPSEPSLFTQSSPPDFNMQIQPNQFLIRSGSTTSPSLVFNLAIGFVGRFTVTETVSPSIPYAPTPSFYSNPVFLNASCQCSPSYPLPISTTTLTPAGVYTVTATATNGTLTHSTSATIGVTDVFVPAGGAEMLYKWWFDRPAYPGETLFLEANFTDLGYNSIGITNLQAVLDFGLYGRITGSTLTVNPYNTGSKGFAITIPTDAALGASCYCHD